MPYCELCDATPCRRPHLVGYERCDWCGEEGVYLEHLCKRCFFSDKSRYEEPLISSTRRCSNCGVKYPRRGYHRC